MARAAVGRTVWDLAERSGEIRDGGVRWVALGLKEGDGIAYVIENGRVAITRAALKQTQDNPFATFTEWHI